MLRAVVRHARSLGLALLFGAVAHESAHGQVPTRDTTRTRRDSTRADSLRRIGRDSISVAIPSPADSARADSARARQVADSVRAEKLARKTADSVKAPLARGEISPNTDIGERYRWDRDQIFSSGALTLGELLGRVPGVSAFASGWISTPQTNTYVGDFRRIRVFYDGVELDPLDPTMGPMHDFGTLPMWTLEELVVERAAEELRVYMRSWRVNKTTPYTRADISTGDLATNSYRGFFGRRFSNSYALQIGAQQYSNEDQRAGGDGNSLGLMARVGWAKKQWSVDAMTIRARKNRNEQLREEGFPGTNLPKLNGTRSDSYFRIGYGDTDGPRWLQLIASTSRFVETNDKTTTTTTTTPGTPTTPFVGDTVDTTASHAQYVATAGLRMSGAAVSATVRYRTLNTYWYLTPSARLSYDRGALSLTAYAEQQESDSAFRGDVSARVRLLSFLSVGGSLGQTRPIEGNERPATLGYRGEVGLRMGRLWATGGIMSLDTTIVPPPRVYDTTYVARTVGPRQAYFATLRGPIWKGVGLDVVGSKWSWTNSADSSYVPLYQVRSSIYASTSWLSRFPQGNFHILLRATHEYRTAVLFPVTQTPAQFSSQYRVISTLFELRLYDATISWQYRNVMGAIYNVVPGFTAPRAINYYGVRWDFFN